MKGRLGDETAFGSRFCSVVMVKHPGSGRTTLPSLLGHPLRWQLFGTSSGEHDTRFRVDKSSILVGGSKNERKVRFLAQ